MLKKMESLDSFLGEIHDLKEAKLLLDDILQHYDIYGRQFNKLDDTLKIPNPTLQKALGSDIDKPEYAHMRTTEAGILNDRIRDYQRFDDSE